MDVRRYVYCIISYIAKAILTIIVSPIFIVVLIILVINDTSFWKQVIWKRRDK